MTRLADHKMTRSSYDVDTARVADDERSVRIRRVQEAKAARYLTRTGNTDLLDMLGLTPPQPPRTTCRCCGNALPVSLVRERSKYGVGYCLRRTCQAVRKAARS